MIARKVLLGLLLLAAGGCARYAEIRSAGPQAYYQTAYPADDVASELERILASIVQIHITGSYNTFVFAPESAPTESELQTSARTVLARATNRLSSSRTHAATGLVIATTESRLTLLTADHSLNFPDTIVELFGPEEPVAAARGPTRLVERVSIKSRQTNVIASPRFVETLDVLARDPAVDLALLGVAFDQPLDPNEIRSLTVTPGDPRRLSWASFVYILGYPGGFRMVTRGIVSEPRRDGTFLVDGLWNEGMSGGPILAMRGDGSGLEWVGVARAAAARIENRLVPEEGAETAQVSRAPYLGPIYLERTEAIRYGITFSVPTPVIRRFLDDNRSAVGRARYPLPLL